MTSLYGIVSITELENFMGYTFTQLNSSAYSNTVIESLISQAERWVNSVAISFGYEFNSSNKPAGIVWIVMELAQLYIRKHMIDHGFLDKDKTGPIDIMKETSKEGSIYQNLIGTLQGLGGGIVDVVLVDKFDPYLMRNHDEVFPY